MKRNLSNAQEPLSSTQGEVDQSAQKHYLDNPNTTSDAKTILISEEEIGAILQNGEMEMIERLPYSSNYNLLVLIRSAEQELPAVYKPRRGENPLWDFTSGTLCQREVAAYQVSALLNWSLIPPTVLRDGLHGIGSVQLYIDHDDSEHYFTVQEDARYAPVFRQITLFDFITNNADRKSGHCLIDHTRRLWAIDHGICFHQDYKLRTVIWEFSGHPIEGPFLHDIARFHRSLIESNDDIQSDTQYDIQGDIQGNASPPDSKQLPQLLSPTEYQAMADRTALLLEARTYPEPLPDRRNYPWPPV